MGTNCKENCRQSSKRRERKAYQATSAIPSAEVAKPAPKSYAELAREEARADLKETLSSLFDIRFTAKKALLSCRYEW